MPKADRVGTPPVSNNDARTTREIVFVWASGGSGFSKNAIPIGGESLEKPFQESIEELMKTEGGSDQEKNLFLRFVVDDPTRQKNAWLTELQEIYPHAVTVETPQAWTTRMVQTQANQRGLSQEDLACCDALWGYICSFQTLQERMQARGHVKRLLNNLSPQDFPVMLQDDVPRISAHAQHFTPEKRYLIKDCNGKHVYLPSNASSFFWGVYEPLYHVQRHATEGNPALFADLVKTYPENSTSDVRIALDPDLWCAIVAPNGTWDINFFHNMMNKIDRSLESFSRQFPGDVPRAWNGKTIDGVAIRLGGHEVSKKQQAFLQHLSAWLHHSQLRPGSNNKKLWAPAHQELGYLCEEWNDGKTKRTKQYLWNVSQGYYTKPFQDSLLNMFAGIAQDSFLHSADKSEQWGQASSGAWRGEGNAILQAQADQCLHFFLAHIKKFGANPKAAEDLLTWRMETHNVINFGAFQKHVEEAFWNAWRQHFQQGTDLGIGLDAWVAQNTDTFLQEDVDKQSTILGVLAESVGFNKRDYQLSFENVKRAYDMFKNGKSLLKRLQNKAEDTANEGCVRKRAKTGVQEAPEEDDLLSGVWLGILNDANLQDSTDNKPDSCLENIWKI